MRREPKTGVMEAIEHLCRASRAESIEDVRAALDDARVAIDRMELADLQERNQALQERGRELRERLAPHYADVDRSFSSALR